MSLVNSLVIMNRPLVLIKDNLIIPLQATKERVSEIKQESIHATNGVVLNGLFLMLVSYLECMQKEILIHFLKYQPEKLPTKALELDKSTLLDNEDFDLLERLVSDQVDRMPFWRLNKLFYEALKLETPRNESEIQEIKNRRNELIHKNLKVNFKRKEAKYDHIDPAYLSKCISEYENYLSELESSISKSFRKCTKLRALENLWHYTFRTPLCANFSEYWHIDEENDSLLGCKHPKNESDLSSSEIFMLEIWRTQVCGGKVNFPNMSSIGKRTQNCLYLFLKLSNDIFLYNA